MAKMKDPELELYTQELWDTLMRIINNFRAGMAAWEKVGLTFPQTMLLLELQKVGLCSMGELAERLRITQGVATRMVDLLLDKGLVDRRRDKTDRRMVMVSPSGEGTRIAREIERVNRRKMGELLNAVPGKERDDLLSFLKGLERQFEKEGTT
jgi:MarR family transcriptional regulator, organic hydroperoxide resistance regulator